MLKQTFLENNVNAKKPLALFDISTNMASYNGVWMIIGDNVFNFRSNIYGKEVYAAKNQKGYLKFSDLEYEYKHNRIDSPYVYYITKYFKYA